VSLPGVDSTGRPLTPSVPKHAKRKQAPKLISDWKCVTKDDSIELKIAKARKGAGEAHQQHSSQGSGDRTRTEEEEVRMGRRRLPAPARPRRGRRCRPRRRAPAPANGRSSPLRHRRYPKASGS